MKWLVTFLAAVIAAVVIGVLLSYEPGYVMIAYGTLRVEVTLFVFLLIYVGLLLLGAGAWWLTVRLVGTPGRLRRRFSLRSERKAAQRYTQGVVALAQGRLQVAERALEQAAQGVLTLPALLAAAHAADHAGERERRDAYLQRAADSDERSMPAVLITQARLDLAHGDYERALASLQALRRQGGRHPQAERDLARIYAALNEPVKMLQLLPSLVNRPEADDAELAGWAASALSGAVALGKEKPMAVFKRLPPGLREKPQVVRALAAACAHGDPDAASEVLERSLKRGYDAGNVAAYAALDSIPPATRLRVLEEWLSRYGERDELLKAAGRVALEAGFWGRARGYLSKLRTRAPDAETAFLLGQVAEKEGRPMDACEAYRTGLQEAVRPRSYDDVQR